MNIFKVIYYCCKVRIIRLSSKEFNDLCFQCAHDQTSIFENILVKYFYRHNVSKDEAPIIFYYGFIIMYLFLSHKRLRERGFPQEIFNYLVENKQFERLQRYCLILKFTPEQEQKLVQLVEKEKVIKIEGNSFAGVLDYYLRNGEEPFCCEASQIELLNLDDYFFDKLIERQSVILRGATDILMKKLESTNDASLIKRLLCYGYIVSEVHRNVLIEKYDLQTEICISEVRRKLVAEDLMKDIILRYGRVRYNWKENEIILRYNGFTENSSFNKDKFFKEEIMPILKDSDVTVNFIAWIVYTFPTKKVKELAIDKLQKTVSNIFEFMEINYSQVSSIMKYIERIISRTRYSLLSKNNQNV